MKIKIDNFKELHPGDIVQVYEGDILVYFGLVVDKTRHCTINLKLFTPEHVNARGAQPYGEVFPAGHIVELALLANDTFYKVG